MKIRPYIISTALGSLIVLVWQVISAFLGMSFLRNSMGSVLANPQDMPPDAISKVIGGGMLFACVGLLVIGANLYPHQDLHCNGLHTISRSSSVCSS